MASYTLDPDDPRQYDNLGKMVCFHGRYSLGDKHNYNSHDYNGWEEMKSCIVKKEDVLVILPLYLYDHSGITMNTTGFSCPWDSGQVGWIYATKKDVKEWYGLKRINKPYIDKVREILLGEVKAYDRYLTGEHEYEEVED
jgi:hypothetical protein